MTMHFTESCLNATLPNLEDVDYRVALIHSVLTPETLSIKSFHKIELNDLENI